MFSLLHPRLATVPPPHEENDISSNSNDVSQRTDPLLQNTSRIEQRSKTIEIDVKELFRKREKPPNEEFDDDKHFLLSLLPIIKKFNDCDKINVRIEIMNAIRNIQVRSQKVEEF